VWLSAASRDNPTANIYGMPGYRHPVYRIRRKSLLEEGFSEMFGSKARPVITRRTLGIFFETAVECGQVVKTAAERDIRDGAFR
jgi:hypothetical protein